MFPPPLPRVLALPLVLSCAAAAQNLLQINEVQFEDQWIEIVNFDRVAIDLSDWSIYQATHTPGAPQNYWWPIPAGTVLPPGQFLRVRWLHPVEAGNTNPLLLDTGDTSYHFLFFLRGEPLSRAGGALALCATKDAGRVNTASYYRDFVAWGPTTPFLREDLAVQNGRWIAGARTRPPLAAHSLALDSRSLLEPTPAGAFFRDSSPTASAANHTTQTTVVYGDPCVLGLGPPSQLHLFSVPVHGNVDFALVADNLLDQRTLFTFVFGMATPLGGPWVPPCRAYIDLKGPLSIIPVMITGDRAVYRPDVEYFSIPEVGVQGVGWRANSTTVITNGGTLKS